MGKIKKDKFKKDTTKGTVSKSNKVLHLFDIRLSGLYDLFREFDEAKIYKHQGRERLRSDDKLNGKVKADCKRS